MQKPPVHLWIYNHPFFGISDQVAFFVASLRQHGYPVSVGRTPCASALNVVIENFSSYNRDVLIGFCKALRKRVAVIVTEHMDFENGYIHFHGSPLGTDSEYMHKTTQVTRVRNLMECLPQVMCLLVLGDLPQLRNAGNVFPGVEIRRIPFPALHDGRPSDRHRAITVKNELIFTGGLTEHRKQVLVSLRAEGVTVACPEAFVSRRRRDQLNRSAKVVLNIPQSGEWRWLSPMRIIAGLACERPTVSIGRTDATSISRCCTEVDMQGRNWVAVIKHCVEQSEAIFRRDMLNYSDMVKRFEAVNPFPDDMFVLWGMIERVI